MNKYKALVDPAFHHLMAVPAINYDRKTLLSFVRWYAKLNYKLTKPHKGVMNSVLIASDGNVSVAVDHFRNTAITGKRPCLLYFHGGGFAMPAFGYQKKLLSEYALGAHCDVISVDYSLTPEATSTKILNESFTALNWLMANVDCLNIDSNKIAVGGDSAGGCLAASVTQLAADKLDPRIIKFQLLIYPVLDNRMVTDSMKKFQDAPVWSGHATKVMWDKYLSSGSDACEYSVPMERQTLSNLPPAYMESAEVDPLHDEAVIYADKLKASGVPVCLYETKGTPHGYDCLLNAEITRASVSRRISALISAFGN